MTNLQLVDLLLRIGYKISRDEQLPLKSITYTQKLKKYQGLCHADGRIEIKFRTSRTLLERVRIQEAARDLSHELAHLKHGNHGPEFYKYLAYLLGKMQAYFPLVPLIPERTQDVSFTELSRIMEHSKNDQKRNP